MKNRSWTLLTALLVACEPGGGPNLPDESSSAGGVVLLAPGGNATASFTARWYADRGTLSVFALLVPSSPGSFRRTFTLTFPNGETFTGSDEGGGDIGTEKNVRCQKAYGCAMEALGKITFEDLRDPIEDAEASEVSWSLSFSVGPSVPGMKVSNLEITVADQDAGTD